MRLVLTSLVLISLLPWRAAMADGPLRGTYVLGGKTRVDAPAGEPRDSHLYMELTGPAAKDLFDRMTSRPVPDACGDEGDVLKTLGDIQCVRSLRGRAIRCWLGIDLAGQRMAPARVC